MPELLHKDLSGVVIGAAIEAHRRLGPGYIEGLYEEALCIELKNMGVPHARQKTIPIHYREHKIGEHRLDLLIDEKLVVELKAIKALEDIHFSIVRSYLKAANLESGLLLNFAAMPLTVKRVGRERGNPLD